MRKLVVSLAVLGLVGLSPAHAHKAEGVKCRAKILGVTFVEGDVWQPNGHQQVETRLRITNTSTKTLKPKLTAGIYDLNDPDLKWDDEYLGNDELLAPKLKPGESKSQHAYVVVDYNVNVEAIKVDACHRSWHDFDED